MVTITQPGNYTASVSGTCGQGSDIITITLDGCNQPDPEPEPEPEPDDSAPVLIAPNVFTPKNGDEVNNTYFLRNQNISYLKLIILNRWGNVVFEGESSDLLNNNPSWDGTNATEGVYFYRYEARDNNEQPFEGHGFITLIR
jgi:gliding motility-associated-like protein